MVRSLFFIVILLLLGGCGMNDARMTAPEDPHGRYREQISAARRLLEQKENWADRAEWEVHKTYGGWEAIAWRVEHPDRKGAERYLPWGYSVIELDSRFVTTGYHRKG